MASPEVEDLTREGLRGGGADARRPRRSRQLPVSPVLRPGHAVAEAVLAEDVSGVAGIVAEITAELADGVAHGLRVGAARVAGTAKAVLDGQELETLPIMEYVWERTNRVLGDGRGATVLGSVRWKSEYEPFG